jgi:cysteine synthase A
MMLTAAPSIAFKAAVGGRVVQPKARAAAAVRPTRARRTVTPQARIYENILETVGNTPVIKINQLAPEGVTIYAKAEYFNPCSSVKDR